jgi:glutaredoxin 3
MAEVILYGTQYCPYCTAARALLADKGVEFTDVDVTGKTEERRKLVQLSGGRTTVPQIFVDGRAIGGYDELAALDRKGELDALLRL